MFTFAHFSDLHLAPVPRPKLAQLIGKRLQSYLSWLTKRQYRHKEEILNHALSALRGYAPEHLCVTGDLVNLALPEEIEQAAAWLRALEPEFSCSVVPGNHDALVASVRAQVMSSWAPWMGGPPHDDGLGASSAPANFPYLVRQGPAAFIGLNSAITTAPCLSSGRVSRAQLTELKGLLLRTAQEGLFRVLLIHHPPRVNCDSFRRRLSNAGELLDVLQSHGAELVLHGHLQEPVIGDLQGPSASIPVYGAGSTSLDDNLRGDTGHFHGFRLQRDGRGWKLQADHFCYRAERRAFAIEATQSLYYPEAGR